MPTLLLSHLPTARRPDGLLVPGRLAGTPRSYALLFAGGTATDNVNVGHPSSLNSLAQMSLLAWYYPRSLGGGSGGRIFQKQVIWNIAGTNALSLTATFSTTNGAWTTANNSLVLNTWQHVVLTYDTTATGNDPLMYINGVSVTVTRNTAPVGTIVADTSIGLIVGNNNSSGGSRCHDGYFQDVRMHNTILTPAQIASIWASGDTTAPGCVLRLPFDEGGGLVARDDSNNGNVGTILGAQFSAFTHP